MEALKGPPPTTINGPATMVDDTFAVNPPNDAVMLTFPGRNPVAMPEEEMVQSVVLEDVHVAVVVRSCVELSE